MVHQDERLRDILLCIHDGSIVRLDATDDEIKWCIKEGLVERVLPEGVTMAFKKPVKPHEDFDPATAPKLRNLRLTSKGKQRLRELLPPELAVLKRL